MKRCKKKISTRKKCCVIKKSIKIVCGSKCKPIKKRKLKPRRVIKRVCPRPVVNVTTPTPVVNVTDEAPVVNVPAQEDACLAAIRADLNLFRGREIEVIDSAGSGAGGEPPNRIGILENVGEGSFAIRPTMGNPQNSQVVYYSICEIIGFRPLTPVGNPVPIA